MAVSREKRRCKFLGFIDLQDGQIPDDKEVFIDIVCVEISDVGTVIAEWKASGFIELPHIGSTDCKLYPEEIVNVEVVNDARGGDGSPVDAYSIRYLPGSDNHLRFPLCVTGSGRVSFVLIQDKDSSTLCRFYFHIHDIIANGKHSRIQLIRWRH